MTEQVCLLTDDPFTGWCLILGAACVLGLCVSVAEEVYKRGFNAGRESMRRQVHHAGFQVMREVSDNKYAAAVAWRVVRRVFGA